MLLETKYQRTRTSSFLCFLYLCISTRRCSLFLASSFCLFLPNMYISMYLFFAIFSRCLLNDVATTTTTTKGGKGKKKQDSESFHSFNPWYIYPKKKKENENEKHTHLLPCIRNHHPRYVLCIINVPAA